ncbi:MAG: hypothetical protein ISR76_10020 [Planctomycetes bacterium]|nr:hypothetical protein [Planctomycetota bacterium]MBL7009324.1 hypothetical protein [Planctomycetota bacterium]
MALENGPFSSKDFPGFSETVVPYLNIASRVPERKDDGLLGEYGGTGFPTLMFLDPDGRKIMRSGRSQAEFEKGRDEAQEFLELVAKADAGDVKAQIPVFLKQLEFGWFTVEEARAKLAGFEKVSKKDLKAIEVLLVETEVRGLAKQAGRDLDKRREAGARCAEMWGDKQVPEDMDCMIQFWALIADHAEAKGDKKLMKKVVKEADKTVKKDTSGRALVKILEQRLKDM